MSKRCRPPSNSQGSLDQSRWHLGLLAVTLPCPNPPGALQVCIYLCLWGLCCWEVSQRCLFPWALCKGILFLLGLPEMGKCEGALFWKKQEVWNTAASSVIPASGRAKATALSWPGAEHGILCDLAWVPVGRVDPTGPGTLFFLGDLWL